MNTKARLETKKTEPESAPSPVFTAQRVENRFVAVLASALRARGGSVLSFAEWARAGHGVVLVLSSGPEFWMTLAVASC